MQKLAASSAQSIDREALRPFARKYAWWKTPEQALAAPARVIAQVMDLGDWEDAQALAANVGDEVLRGVLRRAEAGQFRARSWAFWHYRLGLAEIGRVPPLPVRRFR
ncbi:MAG: hypothetical protein ACRD1F_11920 [Terriglobales bacterium]